MSFRSSTTTYCSLPSISETRASRAACRRCSRREPRYRSWVNSHPCKRGRGRDELGLADPAGDVGLSAGVVRDFEDLPGGAELSVGYRYLLCERGLRWPVSAGPERTSKTMKYMLMFWVDESGEVTAEEDAAMMIAVKSWVEQMTERGVRLYGGPLRSAAEASI